MYNLLYSNYNKKYLKNINNQKVTKKSLTPDEVLRARLIQGSQIFHIRGMVALKKYIKEYLKGYKIEKAIDEGIFYSKNGKGRLAFRDTNPRKMKDIMTDFKIVSGGVKTTQHYKNLKKLSKEALKKFKKKLDISGYSLGGAMSYKIGQELGIPSLSLNPLIAQNVVSELGPHNITKKNAEGYGAGIDAKHKILRTLDDPVSLLLTYSKIPANTRIDTIKGDLTNVNPVESHYLKNFIY